MFVSLQTVLRVVNPPQAGFASHHKTAAEIVVFFVRISLPAARAPGAHFNGGTEAAAIVATSMLYIFQSIQKYSVQ